MSPSADALAMFADFGVDATLNGVQVRGLFDNGSTQVLNTMLGGNPQFTCLASDAGTDARGKILIVEAVSYTVREVKPDGTGFMLFELDQS